MIVTQDCSAALVKGSKGSRIETKWLYQGLANVLLAVYDTGSYDSKQAESDIMKTGAEVLSQDRSPKRCYINFVLCGRQRIVARCHSPAASHGMLLFS